MAICSAVLGEHGQHDNCIVLMENDFIVHLWDSDGWDKRKFVQFVEASILCV